MSVLYWWVLNSLAVDLQGSERLEVYPLFIQACFMRLKAGGYLCIQQEDLKFLNHNGDL